MNLSETSESTSLAMGERINFARSCSQRVTYRRNFRTYIERYTIPPKLSIKKQFHPIHVKIPWKLCSYRDDYVLFHNGDSVVREFDVYVTEARG